MVPKTLVRGLGIVFFVQAGLAGLAAAQDVAPQPSTHAAEFIVKFKSTHSLSTILANKSLTKLLEKVAPDSHALPCGGTYLVRLNPAAGSVDQVLAALKAEPAVKGAVEYAVSNHLPSPVGPIVHEPAADLAQDWNLKQISAPEAWQKVPDASQVIVAVIDSGVYYRHPNLAGNLWQNPDEVGGHSGVDDDKNGVIDDVFGARFIGNQVSGDPAEFTGIGHGTPVAGLIASSGSDNPVFKGVAPKVKLMSVKFMHDSAVADSAGADPGTMSDAIKAIDYAVRNGATIINMSWGDAKRSQPLTDCMAQIAREHPEVLFVVSAGNYGVDIGLAGHYPASDGSPNMVVVTATRQDGMLGKSSNWAPKLVHLAAPGYQIWSIAPLGSSVPYGTYSGTTFAAPHVSGAAALLKAQHPLWTFTQLKLHLMASADQFPGSQGAVAGGRLNVKRAVFGPLENVAGDGGDGWKIGSLRKIHWNVAYQTPVCTRVDILWSSDGGTSFPLALAAYVANSGERNVTVPPDATQQGVVRVQCSETRFTADSARIVTQY
jgi:subtilisin family serine protease